MSRPRVITCNVADRYSGPRERIVEFSSANGGGLISFRETEDGKLIIDVYRCDDTVVVQGTAASLA